MIRYDMIGSWAKDVRLWEVVDGGARTIPRASLSHAGPVLSCSFAQVYYRYSI
jgi:hypothetical protein